MSKKITVNSEIKETLPLSYFSVLQGNLKTLSDDRYRKIKTSILKHGFCFPMFVWQDDENNKHWLIDGSQRFNALNRMKDEGYSIPQIPVVFIPASSIQDAKSKILAAASQYGQFTDLGVSEFLQGLEWDKEDLLGSVEIPFLDKALEMPVVLESDDGKEFTEVSAHQREINANPKVEEEPQEPPKCICPQCGHEFNPFEDKKPKVKVRKKKDASMGS